MRIIPRMTDFRWGILGTGKIAGEFAEGLCAVDGAELAAVGSRSQESASRFASKHGARRTHATYASLANDPEVDAVYVSTPHPYHAENTLLCLEAGKPVLCEKPFALNAREAAKMSEYARARGVFLMEAMWTRWNPVTVRVREIISSGRLGEIRQVVCDFGFRADFDERGRLFDPALGGGALLDVGVYPVSWAHMVFGREPDEITGIAERGPTGTDDQSAYLLRFGGALAILSSAVRTETRREAVIHGTEGSLHVPTFWRPDRLLLDGEEERFEIRGNGMNYEAEEVMRCIAAGKTESETMPLDESLAVMRTMDTLRSQFGLKYPGE